MVILDSNYCDYLRKYDNKVPYNFNEKEVRPFVGVLFEVNSFKYFAPLTSPKSKHLKMKNTIDFLKLDNGNLGAINFNNMLPVKENNIEILNLNKSYNTKLQCKYQKLLKEQIYWLNRNNEKLYSRAKKLYYGYINNELNIKIMNRCCNFKLLEEKCEQYNLVLI